MTRLKARVQGALLVAALLAAGLWYLTDEPAVGRAFAGVLIVGAIVALSVLRLRTIGSRRRLQTLGDLLSLSPAAFEDAVAALLARSNYRRVNVVGRAADLGVDITCFDSRGRPVVVQCKRHAPGIAVGSGEVQRFLGSITHAGAHRGVMVTTSRFSGPAVDLAEQHGIELLDGVALVDMIRRARRRRPAVRTGA